MLERTLWVGLLLAGQAAAQGDLLSPSERAWLAEHPVIRLAPTADYNPVEFLDEDGKWRGITADVFALIQERLGVSFQVVRSAADRRERQPLRMGADVIPLSAPTEGRSEYWLFGDPYLEFPVKVLVRKGADGDLVPNTLNGMTVAVVEGWAVQEYMETSQPGVILEPVPDTREGLRRLSLGWVDAFLSDLPVATHFMTEEGIANLHIACDAGYTYRMGISVRRDWPELHAILQKGLATVTEEELAAIYDRWVTLDPDPSWFFNPRLWAGLSAGFLVLFVLFGSILQWNRSLSRQVALRTAEAEREFEERLQAERVRARLERELRQAQRMESLGTIAGGIAHDFNNILLSIYGFSELARKELASGSKASRFLEEVLKASDRAKDLVRQILTFSRQTEQDRRPIELAEAVREAMALLRASLPATIEIEERYPREVCVVRADSAQVHQVVMNIATNAAHAMDAEVGRLEVTVEPVSLSPAEATRIGAGSGEDFARLTIRDDGRGMDAETRERVFEPFFTTKGPGEGTGLGLSVVHGIVLAHQGGVEVESEPGRGSAFHVYFPRSGEAPYEPAHRPVEGEEGTESVLVVDDEETLVRLVQRHLEDRGYRVQAFHRPEDALDALRRDPKGFDLVVTDQTMPRMTGLALAREARTVRAELPVVLVTGYGEALKPELLEQASLDAILNKPYSGHDLARVVRTVLDRGAPAARQGAPT